MKKLFLIALFLVLNSTTPTYSMETYSNLYKVPQNLKSLSNIEIIELIMDTYLQIPFPNTSSKDLKNFIEKIEDKNFDLANSKPTFEQLNFILNVIIVFQPKLETLDLSNCELTKLPTILKEMQSLKNINLAGNNLNKSEFNNLPTSIEKLTHSQPDIALPADLTKLEFIVIIPTSTIIDL